MSYLVIARKWRPQTFADIVGQEHITRTLQNAIRTQRIAHAFLFTGVRGVGKTTAARILAKALNCEHGPTPTPCNQCTHCEEIAQGKSIDVLEIDGASNRGIDEIRQIIENVRYQPAQCRFKIYIIDEVHQVTKDAFNALLKTLEEPPPSVKFILATTEPHRLPETILSRCQRYDFRRIKLREIVQRLGAIVQSEGLEITEGALALLAREADGSMRDAQSLLEQVLAFSESPESGKAAQVPVDETLLQEVFGLAERQVLYQISSAVIEGDATKCVELVAGVFDRGCDLGRLARDLVEHFRNLLVARLSAPAGKSSVGTYQQLLDLPDQEIKDLREQAAVVSTDTLLDYFDFMAVGEEAISRSPTPRFALETVLIRLANLPKTLATAELIERLETLEKKLGGTVVSKAQVSEERASVLRTAASEPAKRRETATPNVAAPKIAAESPAPQTSESNSWAEFVAFVGREKRLFSSYLESASAVGLPPDPVKITVGERYHLAFWQDEDNLATLKDLAKRFFSRDVALQIVGAPSEILGSAPSANFLTNAVDERSPMVKEALRIFGGSVRNVRRENG